MHPVLFHVGDTAIHAYGVLGAVGFLIVCFLSLRRGAAIGLVKERIADVIFWTAVVSLIGSRGLYVLLNPEQFSGPSDWINLRTGGLVFYGALIAGMPTAGLMIWRYKLPFFGLMDIFATALPLGHAISRVGCVLAGCCFGRPTEMPWGLVYSDPLAPGPHGVPLHPTQLYEAAFLVGITVVVNLFYARKRFDGQVMLLYLTLYAALRTVVELFRGDETRGWFLEGLIGQAVSTSQALSVLVAAGALVVFLMAPRWAKPAATAA